MSTEQEEQDSGERLSHLNDPDAYEEGGYPIVMWSLRGAFRPSSRTDLSDLPSFNSGQYQQSKPPEVIYPDIQAWMNLLITSLFAIAIGALIFMIQLAAITDWAIVGVVILLVVFAILIVGIAVNHSVPLSQIAVSYVVWTVQSHKPFQGYVHIPVLVICTIVLAVTLIRPLIFLYKEKRGNPAKAK